MLIAVIAISDARKLRKKREKEVKGAIIEICFEEEKRFFRNTKNCIDSFNYRHENDPIKLKENLIYPDTEGFHKKFLIWKQLQKEKKKEKKELETITKIQDFKYAERFTNNLSSDIEVEDFKGIRYLDYELRVKFEEKRENKILFDWQELKNSTSFSTFYWGQACKIEEIETHAFIFYFQHPKENSKFITIKMYIENPYNTIRPKDDCKK